MTPYVDQIKRMVNGAKATKGYSWQDIADELTARGLPATAGALAVKHSRGTLKAVEMLVIMKILGVSFVDLTTFG